MQLMSVSWGVAAVSRMNFQVVRQQVNVDNENLVHNTKNYADVANCVVH